MTRGSAGVVAARRPATRAWSATAAIILLSMAAAAARADEAADERIHQRILTRLAGQIAAKPERLQIEVSGGAVRLTGTVASVGERKTVERIVGGVVGVTRVLNELTIRPSQRSEADLAQEVRRLLERRTRFRSAPIEVAVAGGEVTLRGEVERGLDRLDAETIAGGVEGVTRVINNVQVRSGPAHPPEEIRRRVLSILTNPLTFGVLRDLEVEVDGGRVTLRGLAPRMADREQAERLALTVPGVIEVVNALEVAGS